MPAVSIIIPALNEEGGIAAVLDQVAALPIDKEVIVVDDGSTDRTGEIAKGKGAKVIRHPIPMGYGKSLKDGIRVASSDVIAITDADGTYPVHRLLDLLQKFSEGFDMVVGARSGAAYRGSLFKMPARTIFKFLVEFTTGTRIPDVNSGLRVFKKELALRYEEDLCNTFSFTTTVTLVALLTGKIVGFMPIEYGKRIGRSKVRIVRDSLRTLQYIVESIARFNPLKLFLLLSLIPLILGIIGMLLDEYSTALWLGIFTAILVFSMGLLAHALRRP